MRIIKNISLFCGIVSSVFFVVFIALAFTYPTDGPPDGIVYIPINESSSTQIKIGPFEIGGVFITNSAVKLAQGNYSSNVTIGTSATSSDLIVYGNVGVGTISPTSKLDVNGDFRIRGKFYDINNSEGYTGQILTKTDNGIEWKDPVNNCAGYTITINQDQAVCPEGTTTFQRFYKVATCVGGDHTSWHPYCYGYSCTTASGWFNFDNPPNCTYGSGWHSAQGCQYHYSTCTANQWSAVTCVYD